MSNDESVLWQDVRAAAKFSNEVAVPASTSVSNPSALERGVRTYPNGVVEQYERAEFDRRHKRAH